MAEDVGEITREEFKQYAAIISKIREKENNFYATTLVTSIGGGVTLMNIVDAIKYSTPSNTLIALVAAGLTALYVRGYVLPQRKEKQQLEAQKKLLEDKISGIETQA